MHYFDETSSPALRRAPLPNAIAKTPTRKRPSEYLDDVIKICGTLRYAADKIEDSATLDRLRTIFAEAQG